MSGSGWSPEEVYNNAADTGSKMSEAANPFRQDIGEVNAQPESWGPYTPQPYVDPMTLINQKYIKQGADNSLAPMQAYQQYMQNRR